RKMVYRMQVLQELTRTANANGHNTIFLTDLTGPRPGVLSFSTGPSSDRLPVATAPLNAPTPGGGPPLEIHYSAQPRPIEEAESPHILLGKDPERLAAAGLRAAHKNISI